jgi:hypothetical protein
LYHTYIVIINIINARKILNNSSTQHVTPQIYIKKASSSAYLAFMAIKMSFKDQPMHGSKIQNMEGQTYLYMWAYTWMVPQRMEEQTWSYRHMYTLTRLLFRICLDCKHIHESQNKTNVSDL